MSSDQDLKKLNYKRGAIKGKLTAFQKYVCTVSAEPQLTELQLAELQLRFDRIVPIFDEFDALQSEIEMLSASASGEDIGEERNLFEDTYYASMSSAQVLIQKHTRRNSGVNESEVSSASTVVKAHNANFINLPKINLPRFEGGYQDWLAFRDTYLSLIHNNDSINTINKFHYLRASLKGSAALIIQSLDLTCDNYSIAWQLLSERYDNQKLLVANHVNALFNVEPIHKESSQALRNILDATTKNLRALNSLGQPTDSWDTLIVQMMSCKLDSVTTREWEERRNAESTIPTLECFKTFLLQRANFLESLEEININKHKHESSSSSSQVNSKPKSFIVSASFDADRRPSYSNMCPMCKNKHHLYSCHSFRKLPVEARLNKAKLFRVCLNCLCHGHSESQCRLSNCKYCDKKHHTLIHIEPMQVADPESDVPIDISVIADQSACDVQSKRKLLSTAIVKVVDSKGEQKTARIFLDNGSTLNFITSDLCSKLKLRTFPSRSNVTGIMNHTSSTSHQCHIQIQSLDGKYKADVNCSVAPVITSNIPDTHIDVQNIQLPLGIQLADPTFNTPSSIDILVGAEIFWDVLGSNRIDLGTNQPTLRETKLGWLVCGAIHQPKLIVSETCMFTHELPSNSNTDISRFRDLHSIAPRHNHNSKEKPADLVSGGLSADQLVQISVQQWSGPPFIQSDQTQYPSNPNGRSDVLLPQMVERSLVIHEQPENIYTKLIRDSSSFTKFKRVIAYVLRFVNNYNKQLPWKCSLRSLSPFLGDDNFIRVGGRLSNSSYDYDLDHPLLLSSKHHIYIYHLTFLHAEPQLLRERVELEYPFLETGVDYAGPVMISNRKGRGSVLVKAYICAFVCLATKAVHLELVTDLTKEAYIAALRRFIARRGKPQTIFSDNATTFQGTCNEFAKILNASTSSEVTEGIRFCFIPAYAPHFGGLWESAIKSIKHHLRRVLDQTHMTYEEMSTLLIQIEAILNSRPLTPMSDDPNDLCPITPSHFLIGRSTNFVPHPQITASRVSSLQRWNRIELLKQQFWHRFCNEYILWLQQKTKWHSSVGELQEGVLVVVKDKTLPPLLWQLGRVVRVIHGSDGVARVAEIKTKRGVIRRAFNNICPLPVDK